MELVKDIYFNTDKLVENSKVKVSYTGKFYQGNNDKVFLHYGYGKDWNNVNDIEMKKTDLGYQAEIKLACEDTLNFCFKNQSNEWDNNFGKNYIFNIEKENQPIAESKDNVNVFWGKTFGNGNSAKNAEPTEVDAFIPNQADAIIGNNALKFTNEFGTVDVDPSIEIKAGTVVSPTPVENAGVFGNDGIDLLNNGIINSDNTLKTNENIGTGAIVTPININNNGTDCGSNSLNNLKNEFNTPTNIINPINTNKETAIALAPTGFNYWTKKIKDTVCTFFANVPKLISGNYKRFISKNK